MELVMDSIRLISDGLAFQVYFVIVIFKDLYRYFTHNVAWTVLVFLYG